MTAPNLTPAEALAMFKDWKDPDLTGYDFSNKWYVSHDPDSLALIAIAALETLLSEHEATKAKLAAYEQAEQRQKLADAMAGHAKFMAEQESKDLLRLAALREPAAAVPSDEDDSIRNLFHLIDATGVEKPREIKAVLCYLISVTKKLAKRIGVKL